MTWPASPTNGAQTTVNGILFQYDSANTAWIRIFSSGAASAPPYTATVSAAAQPNITSVGSLSGLVSGGAVTFTSASNVSLGPVANVHITGGTTGQLLTTDGTGNMSWTTINNTSIANGTSNVNIPGSGSNVAISVGGISNVFVVTTTGVNVAGTLNTGAGTAVVGNLNVTTDASVGGNLILTGNLFVNGTTTTINSTTTKIIDPIVEQGGGANGATLSSNDAKDRGLLLHYYTSTPVDAFMGWKNSPGEFVLASNASVSSDAVTINNYGNLRVGNANLGNLATSSYFHGVFDSTSSSQPNISSVGTLTSLTVSGLITATAGGVKLGNIQDPSGTNTISLASGSVTMLGNLTIGTGGTGNLTSINANLGNLATSNYFHGVFDNTSNSQPNITSLGTLASLTVAGTGSIIGSNVVSANYFTGTLTTTSQPNISSVGTLSSLNVSGYGSFYTTQDKFAALTGATGVVTHDVSQGPIFYHSSPAAAFTPNFTNVNTTNGYITVLSLLITQGSTAYMPTLDSANIQIAGTNITVKWAQGIVPAGAINTTQLVSYSLLRNASTWTVFGQMSYFS